MMTREAYSYEEFPGILDAILWAAYEESDLYETIGEIKGRYPSISPPEQLQLAKSIVSDLLRKKWVALYRYEYPHGEWEVVDSSKWKSVIELSDNWGLTTPWGYLIDVTEDGKRQIMRQD